MGPSIRWMLAGLLVAVGSRGRSDAADEGPWHLPRLPGPVAVDGRPDEEAWKAIPPLPLTQYAPHWRGTPTQRSEIRVAYDDEALYAAGRFYDDDPGAIRVNSLYRDRWNGDDAFAIYVDAFNDNTNAKWFGTTAAAMRFDLLVSEDGARTNESWDAHWESETSVTSEGWFVEVRIPFSTLGFQAVEGRAVMGLTVTRLVSRSGERVTFPDIDPRFEFRAPSKAQDVVLDGVRSRTPVYLTPYVRGGAFRRVDSEGGAWRTRESFEPEVGGDLRYALSGTLTLDLTANTDFAHVEADEEQVALDRFPLFFPEKRRFFQEGSGSFDFATTGGGQLFHSRNIGLTADRFPVPVLAGARLVGRVGQWDVGALDMQTGTLDLSPSENFATLRLRRAVFNPYSLAGVMATSRVSEGHHNLALGADGLFRVHGDEYLTLKWAGTLDDADPADADAVSRSLFNVRWQRRTQRGLSYNFEGLRVGRDYEPGLGFLPRSDVTTANASGNWYFFTDKHRYFRRVYPGALAFQTFRNRDRVLESGMWAAWVQWDTKAGGGGWVEPKVFHENVRTPFRVGDVTIPAGSHTFADLQVVFTMPAGARLRTDVDARAGTFFDGTRQQVIVTPTWNASRHLELGGGYQLTRLRFPARGQGDDIHLARLQVRAALDARASANAFVQYNSTTDRVDLNVRLRYNFAEGTDLWLVYDEGLVTDRLELPGALREPLSASRAIILKCTYTLGR
ncbi:MAG TPA: sugar-binding protein [Vicinamibacteria bacterium]|nr:sugar-binding protein [Vicinamibacteria bacterium]